MNTRILLFLLRQGLIDTQLVAKWSGSQGRTEPYTIMIRSLKRTNTAVVLAIVSGILMTLLTAIMITSTICTHQPPYGILQIAFISSGAIIVICGFRIDLQFKNDIVRLNELLYRGSKVNDRQYFRLCRPYDELKEQARTMLSLDSSILRNCEIHLGLDNSRTLAARRCFKDTHAICVKFDLCVPDQGFYLSKAEPLSKTKLTNATPVPE